MKAFALATLAACTYAASEAELRFINYIARFSKHIPDATEFVERMENFMRNDAYIRIFNATEQLFEVGYSKYSDMDDDDWEKMFGVVQTDGDNKYITAEMAVTNPPESMDWREHGILSSVKEQGDCASGWAFAAADLAAADHAYDSGNVLEFSA